MLCNTTAGSSRIDQGLELDAVNDILVDLGRTTDDRLLYLSSLLKVRAYARELLIANADVPHDLIPRILGGTIAVFGG
jgi:hypothetical protein